MTKKIILAILLFNILTSCYSKEGILHRDRIKSDAINRLNESQNNSDDLFNDL